MKPWSGHLKGGHSDVVLPYVNVQEYINRENFGMRVTAIPFICCVVASSGWVSGGWVSGGRLSSG